MVKTGMKKWQNQGETGFGICIPTLVSENSDITIALAFTINQMLNRSAHP